MDIDDIFPIKTLVAVLLEILVEELDFCRVVDSVNDGLLPVGRDGETVDEVGLVSLINSV